jgi:signal transduction histidine kinase
MNKMLSKTPPYSTLTWVFGFLAIVLMLVTSNNVWKYQENKWEKNLEQEGRKNTLIIKEKFESYERELMGIASLFQSSKKITRSEFKAYVTPFLKAHKFIHSIKWVPRVRNKQRLLMETIGKKDGFNEFQFNTKDDNSNYIPIGPKDEYFPIYYAEPNHKTKLLGYDISTHSGLSTYLNTSRDSGKNIATKTNYWFQNNSNMETLLFFPIYEGNHIPKTITDRRRLFKGTLIAIFNTEETISMAINSYLVPGIFLTVFDEDEKNKIYGNLEEEAPIEHRSLLNNLGRRWTLVWQANLKFQNGPNLTNTRGSSAAVFLFMVFVAIIFQMLASRTKRVEEEVKLRTKELNALKNTLEEKNLSLHKLIKMKNELLGIASHDLRNPLTSIQGYSAFLLTKGDDLSIKKRNNFLKIINTASDNILKLLNDLLSFSAIESGQLSLDLKPNNLRELIEEYIQTYVPLAFEKNITFKMDCQNETTTIFDKPRIGQVLDNLLTNAIKFSPIGGSIEINLETKNGYNLVSVKDQGPGIKNEELGSLFQPFKKLSSNPTGQEKGTGLGLAIAKKMIELHNGFLILESKDGDGAKFIFKLPIKTHSN